MITIWDLRRERGPLCEWCRKREAEQRHHMLIHASKRFYDVLTVPENIMQACSYCHTGVCVLNGYDMRVWFWGVQCERYGVDHMLDWVERLPYKLKVSRRIDFIDNDEAGALCVQTNKRPPHRLGEIVTNLQTPVSQRGNNQRPGSDHNQYTVTSS